ncbi:hypothetical protein IJ579_03785, partial [bacterium]|nr:hypothetical protein [bacterium]
MSVNKGSRFGLLPHKFPSLARLCRANNPVNCLVFLFESYARVIEKGLRVGLFLARGKHTTTKTFPSLAREGIGMGGSICHIKQPTPTLPNHGGRKVNSPRPQRFLVGEGRISMRKLSIRNSGEGTT